MIQRLEISGLVVIEAAELSMGPGLVAITGETGAGKSVLMQSLALLAGGPADPSMVRPGHTHALVQATIRLPDGFWDGLSEGDPAAGLRELVEDEQEVIVSRRVPVEGRSRCYVDGQAVSRDAASALVRRSVRFSAQGDQHTLLSTRSQLRVLDTFAGAEVVADARRVAQLQAAIREVDRDLEGFAARRDEVRRRAEDLQALIDDVEQMDADPDELAGLRAKRERLRHLDALASAAGTAAEALSRHDGEPGGAIDGLGRARDAVEEARAHDVALATVLEHLTTAEALAQEASLSLRAYLSDLEADPGGLVTVEDRLEEYARLERRHGDETARLVERAADAKQDLAALRSEIDDSELRERRQGLVADAVEVADRLHAQRTIAAGKLGRAVGDELSALAMGEADIRVELTRQPGEIGEGTCTFWFRANPGLPEAPLAEAASGGELSRVLLALHAVASGAGEATWVFDEIDAGIGGTTSHAVAGRLRAMSEGMQVIVITHLAPVAAVAETHFRLVKQVASDTTTTQVHQLSGPEIEDELVRMLGGFGDDDEVRDHARRLMS